MYDGDDYYYAFGSYEEALEFSEGNAGAEEPLALVLQEEYIDEPHPGNYIHVKGRRLTEWPVEFLHRPRRNENTIPDFFSLTAPENRGGHHKRACLRISWLTSTVPSNFPGKVRHLFEQDYLSSQLAGPQRPLVRSHLYLTFNALYSRTNGFDSCKGRGQICSNQQLPCSKNRSIV